MKGELPANTPNREHFIQVCEKKAEPKTIREQVWRKYLDRLKWEFNPASRSGTIGLLKPRRSKSALAAERIAE
jgi:uncharacterized protein YifE (UPF0438 family)